MEVHADANLRRGSHHQSQIAVWNGSNNQVLANGPDSNPQWLPYHFGGLNHPAAVFLLQCQNGGGCPADGTAHLYARNIVFRLYDWYDPATPGIGGSIFSGGWVRGGQSLSSASSDYGSGVWRVDATVNGQLVGRAESCNNGGLAWPNTGHPVPCPGSQALNLSLNTATGPFHNGENVVRTAVVDWAGNGSGVVERTVKVDNETPSLAFANAQDPNDPELIKAPVSDKFSGLASGALYMRPVDGSDWTTLDARIGGGALEARVDSESLPAGDYEFKASATDVAGNSVATTRRQNGEPMKLAFPLRAPVELRAHLNRGGSKAQVVGYGTDAKAKGLLLNANGKPIEGQQVTIVESFGAGALLRERVSRATTDERGKWRSKVPAGPSRDVRVRFGGTTKYAPDAKGVGTFLVRSGAKFQTSRKSIPEGNTLEFEGRVRHFGARIPAGGKLLELQVRVKTGRWQTVGQAFRTNKRGYYRRTYRFGRHYAGDTLFRFRVKVRREPKWPYKRTNTRQRKVIVRAR